MNERIQELMVKAGFDVERLRMYHGGFPREDLLVLEDFAKLIVRECAEIALVDGQSTGNFDTFNKIQKHFGVSV